MKPDLPGTGAEGPAVGSNDPDAWAGWGAWSQQSWRRHGVARLEFDRRALPAIFADTAAAAADRTAISVDGAPLSFAEMLARSRVVAGWLAAPDGPAIESGDRVLLAAPTGLDWIHAYLGVLTAGGIVVLANPLSTGPELEHLVRDSGATLVLAGGESLTRCAGTGVRAHDIGEHPWRGHEPLSGPPPGLDADSLALLAYTSGTTGRPKGVPLTHANLVASITSATGAWRFTPEDVVVHALPLYHQHGLGALHAAMVVGSSAAILTRYDTGTLAASARAAGATVLFSVPAIYRRLVAEIDALPEPDRAALRSLRLRICGSAPLDAELADAITLALGAPALVRYGLTESGLDVSQQIDRPAPDSIGSPLPGVELRLVSGGAEVLPGVEGEIQLRGPLVFDGYWHNPEATAAVLDADGWMSTGDIAVLADPAVGLQICGRSKEMIITGGLNVYPREIEIALESHPDVAEAGVAGVADQRWGERVTAWVVPDRGSALAAGSLHPAALIDYAKTLLAPYKCPKRIFLVQELPRTGMGKLQRGRLRIPGNDHGTDADRADTATPTEQAASAAQGEGNER